MNNFLSLLNEFNHLRIEEAIDYTEDKLFYYKAIKDTHETKDREVFRSFMYKQQIKYLSTEIKYYKEAKKDRGMHL